MRRITTALLSILLFTAIAAGLSKEVRAETVKSDHAEAELVSEVESIRPGEPFWVALRLKMEEHWHTYWINPGDSGLPTAINWKLPEGFRADQIQWPFPQKIEVPPLVTFGYEGEIFLLVKISPPQSLPADSTASISAAAEWLVCKEICLPRKADLMLQLPVKNETPKFSSKWADAFASTRAKLPISSSEWKSAASIEGDKIIVRAAAPEGFDGDPKDIFFFPLQNGIVDYQVGQSVKKSPEGLIIELAKSPFSTENPTNIQGVLYAKDGWRGKGSEQALMVDAPLGGAVAAASSKSSAAAAQTKPALSSLWLALAFSFIGGLILNLMPCVLPVLSIKVLDFVNQASKDKAKVWRHGLIFTFGVLVSFWILAGVLLALRAGGEQLGWGFQLQSPAFVIVLASIFFLFGLNLFGVFEVGTSLMGIGAKASSDSGKLNSFLSGALATVVATPCTAPFMGSALGFALTQPVWASMLIFTSLGLGMAAPYMLLSLSPSLLRFVPKPGVWMESFRQFMGFLLMSAIVWLVWVLGSQAGLEAVTALLLALLLMGMGAWILGRWGSLVNTAHARFAARTIFALLLIGGFAVALTGTGAGAPASSASADASNDGVKWETFSPKRVEELRAAGKPVFIDFTAAWCLSCKVNEKVALGSAEVRNEFEKLGIVALKADWTSRDETITRALAEFGRSGVPLYVLYGSKPDQSPIILPEVITPGIVLEELKKIK